MTSATYVWFATLTVTFPVALSDTNTLIVPFPRSTTLTSDSFSVTVNMVEFDDLRYL